MTVRRMMALVPILVTIQVAETLHGEFESGEHYLDTHTEYGDQLDTPNEYGDHLHIPKGYGDQLGGSKGYGDQLDSSKGYGDQLDTPKGYGDQLDSSKGYGNKMHLDKKMLYNQKEINTITCDKRQFPAFCHILREQFDRVERSQQLSGYGANALVPLVDTNNDGSLDFKEFSDQILRCITAVFNAMDRDKDGEICLGSETSPDGMTSGGDLTSQLTGEIFVFLDANRDSVIGRDEWRNITMQITGDQDETIFNKMDSNKDGRATQQEFETFFRMPSDVSKFLNQNDQNNGSQNYFNLAPEFHAVVRILGESCRSASSYLLRETITTADADHNSCMSLVELLSIQNYTSIVADFSSPNWNDIRYIIQNGIFMT